MDGRYAKIRINERKQIQELYVRNMLEPVDDKDIKGRSGHAGKGDYYSKYRKAVEQSEIVPWLFKQLEKKQVVKVKNANIAKELGPDFVNKNPTSLQWALKYVLYYKGIVVATAAHVDGSEVLTFRKKGPNDKLPDSLNKKVYKEDQQETELEIETKEQTNE